MVRPRGSGVGSRGGRTEVDPSRSPTPSPARPPKQVVMGLAGWVSSLFLLDEGVLWLLVLGGVGLSEVIVCLQSGPVLTRTPRSLRTVRTGYVYQPPACFTTRGTGQLAPEGHYCTYAVSVPASGVPYVSRTVAPQVWSYLRVQQGLGIGVSSSEAGRSQPPQAVHSRLWRLVHRVRCRRRAVHCVWLRGDMLVWNCIAGDTHSVSYRK